MSKKLSKQISLGIDPLTGKRIRKWIRGDTKTELRQAEKKALADFARNGAPSSILFKDFKKNWFEAYKGNVQPHTKEVYLSALKASDPLNQKKVKDITRTDLQKTINAYWNTPTSCHLYVSFLRHMWGVAIADGIVSKNITAGLSTPKRSRIARRPLTENELTGIKKADLDESERFLVDILLQFGLRPGEAFALNKKSFNRKDRTLTIDKAVAYDQNVPFIKSTKTGVTRVLPVPDSFWQKIPDTKTLYYFVTEDGKLLTKALKTTMARNIRKKINQAMGGNDKLQLTDLTLYIFRHHKASLLYYLPGVSLKKKAEYMGHSEKMFLEIYSHMMEEKEDSEALREAVNL